MTAPMELLASLQMDGGLWGDTAEAWQVADALAVFDRVTPMYFLTRPRGGRKSADAAGYAVALHITSAPVGATSYCMAADAAQAALILDSVRWLRPPSAVAPGDDAGRGPPGRVPLRW